MAEIINNEVKELEKKMLKLSDEIKWDNLTTKANELIHSENTWFWKELLSSPRERMSMFEKVIKDNSLLSFFNIETAKDMSPIDTLSTWPIGTFQRIIENKNDLMPTVDISRQKPSSSTEILNFSSFKQSVTLTRKMLNLKARTPWWLKQYVIDKIKESYTDTLLNFIINWDTDLTATNINSDWTVPTGTEYYLWADWIRKTILANTGLAQDLWALDLQDLRWLKKIVWNVWGALNDFAWITTEDVYDEISAFPSFSQSNQSWISPSTAVTWQLSTILWRKIYSSPYVPDTKANGKIDPVTAANNIAAQIFYISKHAVECHVTKMDHDLIKWSDFDYQFLCAVDFAMKVHPIIPESNIRWNCLAWWINIIT